jgi:hypothetical protein
MTAGRPTDYSDALADEILRIVSETTVSLQSLCKSISYFPSHQTIHRWRWENKEFCDRYDKALSHKAHLYAEEAISIADDDSSDYTYDEEGNQVANLQHLQRVKMRIEIRKWFASKLAHRIYGDKIQQETTINVIPYQEQLKELE